MGTRARNTQDQGCALEGSRPRAVHLVRAGECAALCLRRHRRACRRNRGRRLGRGRADLPRRTAGDAEARSRASGAGPSFRHGNHRRARVSGRAMYQLLDSRPQQTLPEKLWNINWGLVLLLAVIAGIGFAMLYSAANGSWQPWAGKQAIRFGVALVLMLGVALVDLRFWLRYASAYIFYGVAVGLLLLVQLHGHLGMGAQRWIDLGVIQLQPSEIMKIALVLALARYFHSLSNENAGRISQLIVPALLVAAPVALVLKQPDLGTAMMLLASGAILFFLGGIRLWIFAAGTLAVAATMPLAWSMLRDYQKTRLITFLDPDADP